MAIEVKCRAVRGRFAVLRAESEGGLNELAEPVILAFVRHGEPGHILVHAFRPFILPIWAMQGGQRMQLAGLFLPDPVRDEMRIEHDRARVRRTRASLREPDKPTQDWRPGSTEPPLGRGGVNQEVGRGVGVRP